MEILLHSANVIYLVSYVMRDILWLRFFTIIAALCLIFVFLLSPGTASDAGVLECSVCFPERVLGYSIAPGAQTGPTDCGRTATLRPGISAGVTARDDQFAQNRQMAGGSH